MYTTHGGTEIMIVSWQTLIIHGLTYFLMVRYKFYKLTCAIINTINLLLERLTWTISRRLIGGGSHRHDQWAECYQVGTHW